MTIFDTSKSLVENLYLLSGPILAILGFAAISQLKLTKKALITTSKRQAAELATKQIEIYTKEIIPIQDELFLNEEKKKITRYNITNLTKFTLNELKEKFDSEIIAEKSKIVVSNPESNIPMLRILNAMDTFSTYFVKGVADEEIAYSAIGQTFCNQIEEYAIDICFSRVKDNSKYFKNIIELYSIWNTRLKADNLSEEVFQKQKELQKMRLKKIDIIGTK